MIYWLIVAILAYLFFGLSSLGDKAVLTGKPKPDSYIFYVGVFGLITIVLIPFINFGFPSYFGLFWIVLYALVHIAGLYSMYSALERFDVSKVVPTIGAAQPIFIFILAWIFFGPQSMSAVDIFAFVILFLGSTIISIEKTPKITADYLKITLFSSVMFSLEYIFAKQVFLDQPFLQGAIWMGIFIALFASAFLLRKKSRKEIFAKKVVLNKKTERFFLLAQVSGGLGGFLQSFAIFLAPVAFLAIVNSLKGVQYVFLFIITIFVSSLFPKVLKEKISKRLVFQKIISIVLITAGLAMLVIY